MAVVRQGLAEIVTLAFVEADSEEPTWVERLQQGVEAFFTVERTRDTILIVVSGLLYLALAKYARERMVLRPMRIAVAQELRSIRRAG